MKSFKIHLSLVVREVKLTFEELITVLSQIEACLDSRPLAALPCAEHGRVDALTPGHFLVGRPLERLPDPVASYRSLPLLKSGISVRHFSGNFGNAGPLSTLLACGYVQVVFNI